MRLLIPGCAEQVTQRTNRCTMTTDPDRLAMLQPLLRLSRRYVQCLLI